MSALSKRAAEVEQELGAAWTRYHVMKQLSRFGTGVVLAVIWSLHSGVSDWTDVLPVVWSSMWVVAAQMWPQVPWSLLKEHLEGSAPAATPPPATPGGVGG